LVPVRIAEETIPLVLDSGASHLILFEKANLAKEYRTRLESTRGGKQVIAGTLRRLAVGGVSFDDVPAAVAQVSESSERGLLPANLFRAIYADAQAGFVVFNP
jgi:hypothetical protein